MSYRATTSKDCGRLGQNENINLAHFFESAIIIAISIDDIWVPSSLAAIRLCNKSLKGAVDSTLIFAKMPSKYIVHFLECSWVSNIKVLDVFGSASASVLEAVLTTSLLPKLQTFKLDHYLQYGVAIDEEVISTTIKIHPEYLSIDLSRSSTFPSWILDVPSIQSLEIGLALGLETIPDEISNLTALIELHIQNCSGLKNISASIGQLKALKLLSLKSCRNLSELPSSLLQLTALKGLVITGNAHIKEFPKDISRLTGLVSLDISYSHCLTAFPDVRALTNLKSLMCQGCSDLTLAPKWMDQLQSLSELHFGGAGLDNPFPSFLCGLTNLVSLAVIQMMTVEQLPEEISQLRALTNLKLGNGRIVREIPESLGELTNLASLEIFNFTALVYLPNNIGNLIKLVVCWKYGEVVGIRDPYGTIIKGGGSSGEGAFHLAPRPIFQ